MSSQAPKVKGGDENEEAEEPESASDDDPQGNDEVMTSTKMPTGVNRNREQNMTSSRGTILFGPKTGWNGRQLTLGI